MRDSVVFYKSFLDAIRNLPEGEFKKATLAILDYGINDVEPKLDGVAQVIFTLVKPQIDANNTRFANGKKGGRPRTKGYEKENQRFQDEEPKENVNVNDNENANENENVKEKKHKYGEYEKVLLTDTEYTKLCEEFGDMKTGKAIKLLDEYIVEKGYKSKSHYLAMRRWVMEAVDKQKSTTKKGYDWDAL